jgi:hypothetical protein
MLRAELKSQLEDHMMRILFAATILLAISLQAQPLAPPTATHRSEATNIARDSHGRIKRSPAARRKFMNESGYPHGRKGYVIDHIKPLECGGPDTPKNMQWQTVAEAKAKDRTESKCPKRGT